MPPSRRLAAGPAAALGLCVLLMAGALPAASATPSGNPLGPDTLVARFTDGPRGIVTVDRNEESGLLILRTAFIGLTPGRTYRLVLATSACGEPALDPIVVTSFASFGVSDERYHVRDVTDRLPEGLDSRISARLRKAGGGGAGCADATLYEHGPLTAAQGFVSLVPQISFNFEKLTWFDRPRTKGIAIVRGVDDDTVQVQSALVRLRDGARHRMVGSSKVCAASHPSSNTRFSTRVRRWTDRLVDGGANLESMTTVRVFRGSGFDTQTGCGILIALLIP